jgi:glycosyltransferase involved in cell wall biosynthesis
MVERLSDEFAFAVLTGDRDLGDEKPYPHIRCNEWQRVGKADVMYLPPSRQRMASWTQHFAQVPHDLVYLNSLLSTQFTIFPMLLRLLKRLPDKPVVLAPRGMFSPGFLALKSAKRCNYIRAARTIGLFRDITWQASSEYEEADIRRWFGGGARVVVAPNVPRPVVSNLTECRVAEKQPGRLKIVFLSRISPKKNLDGALELLSLLRGDIEFAIYGPREDVEYWQRCESLIASLPANIKVSYCGEIPNELVGEAMAKSHVFLFPTRGENFGHVILEAFLSGCPVVISDQTPWRNLEAARVGADIPLEDKKRFVRVLQQFVDMDRDAFTEWATNARAYGCRYSENDEVLEKNRVLFRQALAG